jgi:hypothetical protein
MSLEANKFIFDKINKQAVENEMNIHNDIVRKIKKAQLKEKQEIEETTELDQKAYNLFLDEANDFAFELNNSLEKAQVNKLKDDEKAHLPTLISDYNNLVLVLSRIKYKSLKINDKRKIDNRLNEYLPSLNLLSEMLNRSAKPPDENYFLNYKIKIDQIIRQINEKIFDQVSYPLVS